MLVNLLLINMQSKHRVAFYQMQNQDTTKGNADSKNLTTRFKNWQRQEQLQCLMKHGECLLEEPFRSTRGAGR